ncbi:MAG TPA: class I SAM-dependent methyltransferase [Candidatus Thermoplasmatota archaeon]|nr:class I SAM-dependent methyltransferase [Candidatus Thermoplasmatota archaeon]
MDERIVASQWNAIAASFERARTRPWPQAMEFLRSLPDGARVLDVGCGHGRHGLPARDEGFRVVGADPAPDMVRRAASRGLPVVCASATSLPFRSSSFDATLSIATVHVIPGRALRLRALSEMGRVLVPGGRALVTAWDASEARFERAAPWPGGELGDLSVPWREGGESFPRYMHPYDREELAADARAAGLAIEDLRGAEVGGSRNWLLVARKPS